MERQYGLLTPVFTPQKDQVTPHNQDGDSLERNDCSPILRRSKRKRAGITNGTSVQAVQSKAPPTPGTLEISGRVHRRDPDLSRALTLQKKAIESGIPGHQTARLKYLSYGLTPGQTPFPDHASPIPEECEEVFDRLAQAHGDRVKPAAVPPPNPKVAGCGETPCVLDGLIRTYISGATTMANANSAIDGMIKHFGTIASKGSVSDGSVDYRAIHVADKDTLMETIKSGGLGDLKSKNIKAILAMIHEEENEWKQLHDDNTNVTTLIAKGAATADEVWNLEYLRHLDTSDIFVHLLEYPGIGVKTVACVCLFTLQRPVFAVDTHCWRLCKGLGWVPITAHENETFSHCDLRIPDDLKYRLHQLMIVHGKSCAKCKAGYVDKNQQDTSSVCVLEDLLDRTAMQSKKSKRVVTRTEAEGAR